ncbi:MAG: type I-U CRISPR-associated helicase/endonuclease Cas3 [Rhodanobacter sp.]|nr:MAG: type I-U CRISPR-associated helicase/endonuclease Cas3 [Rhodanobacter sp.]
MQTLEGESAVSDLTVDGFADFFRELHGHDPYPWQRRLAERASREGWPGAIDLPTGSGKTACLDIAIFALACQASLPVGQRSAPRRLFFCVNRRVIVDEAHTRARRIAEMIWQAEQGTLAGKPMLCKVAEALRIVAGTTADHDIPPIDVLELRGGIFRDSRWARSITQPTVVCTTLDQLGSRLLFRGYGVSPNAAPIQAALIAYDSLILLDEAHISEPFRQTLDYVKRYLDPTKWAEEPIGVAPVHVVPMTATPNDEMRKQYVIELETDDRANTGLKNRLSASKPAKLCEATKVVDEAVKAGLEMTADVPTAVGIIVNRIATAREIYEKLCALRLEPNERKRKIPADAAIELVIGSMRPIDRDTQATRLRELVGPNRPGVTTTTSFVVATQCLEVGADYDFDVLVTECASLDALRQRFGRLNRGGRKDAQNNPVSAKAVILMDRKAAKPEEEIEKTEAAKEPSKRHLDPIYGNALARTWNWLGANATDSVIDFGIDAVQRLLDEHGDGGQAPNALLAPSASLNAPVMLPAYIDFWCQTAPRPLPDPDVALFIHGPQGGEPDVQVCWRADLVEDECMNRAQWCDVVALLPPTSAECISLPISRLRRWLASKDDPSRDHSDVLGVGEGEGDDEGKVTKADQKPPSTRPGVLWRGLKDTRLIDLPADLRPGDTLVLPASASSSRVLGHLPEVKRNGLEVTTTEADGPQASPINDVAETAFALARDRAVLRLHPAMHGRFPSCDGFEKLFDSAAKREDPPKHAEWSVMLRNAASGITDSGNDELRQTLRDLSKNPLLIEAYPDRRGVVLTSRHRLGHATGWFIRPMDEGDDESSRTQQDTPVALSDHSRHVRDAAAQAIAHLPLGTLAEPSTLAAYLHDWGKADERFQAMLRRTDRTDAWLLAGATASVIAKSDGLPTTQAQRAAARDRAGLPPGFRHEMLSVQLAELSGLLPDDPDRRALILHLIASHHGYARPLAPVVMDDELPSVEFDGVGLTHDQRKQLVPSHRLDSGIAERFWQLTRRFGWWGLAYLEAALRLADQQASAAEDAVLDDHARRVLVGVADQQASAAEDAGKYDNEHIDQNAGATV